MNYHDEPRTILLDEKKAADLLGVSVRCLQGWRYRSGGPKYVRISRRCCRYRLADLESWIAQRIATSTSDTTEAERLAEQGELPIDNTQKETETTDREDYHG